MDELLNIKIPQHVAIIMDGNGRWAKKNNQERFFGHQKGAETLQEITIFASQIGIKYLTVYAFSKENWKRPTEEVNNLMNLLISGVNEHLEDINKYNIKLKILGDKNSLPANVFEAVERAEKATSNNSGLMLIIALNYSGRWEIVNAVKSIVQKVIENQLDVDKIDEEMFAENLCTAGIPDPDLLIRTSGELRLSNFLLWQLSYTEIFVTETLWPDFNKNCFIEALKSFNNRERRFGKTSEQLNNKNHENE